MTRVRIVTWDLWGWGEIAAALGVSEKTARRWAEDPEDPLPVERRRGSVGARSEDLRAWWDRQATHTDPTD